MLMDIRQKILSNNLSVPFTQLPKIEETIVRSDNNNPPDTSSKFFELVHRSITQTNAANSALSKPFEPIKLPPLPSVLANNYPQIDLNSSGHLPKRTIAHLESLVPSSFYWNNVPPNNNNNNAINIMQLPAKIARTSVNTTPLVTSLNSTTITNSPLNHGQHSTTSSASSFLPSTVDICDHSKPTSSINLTTSTNNTYGNEPSQKVTNSPEPGKQAPGKRKYSQQQWSQLRSQNPASVKQHNILKLPFTMKQIVWSVIQKAMKDQQEGTTSSKDQEDKFKQEGDEEADEIGKLMSKIRNQTYVQLLSTSFFKQQPSEKGVATKRFGCPFECSKWVKGSGNLRRHIEWHLLKLEEDVRKKVKTTVSFEDACKLFLGTFGL